MNIKLQIGDRERGIEGGKEGERRKVEMRRKRSRKVKRGRGGEERRERKGEQRKGGGKKGWGRGEHRCVSL